MFVTESIKVDKYRMLKDSIHDIVSKLGRDEWVTMKDLANKLKEHNVTIQPKALEVMFNNWIDNKDSKIFTNDDYDWVYYDKDNKIAFSTRFFKKPNTLGKSRRKIIEEDRKKRTEKLESNIKKLKLPLTTDIIDNILIINGDRYDHAKTLLSIKRNIKEAIKSGKIKETYDSVFKYLTDTLAKDMNIEIDKNQYDKYKLVDGWVIPTEYDIDEFEPVWHVKYGKGVITSVSTTSITVTFNKDIIKTLRTDAVLRNMSLKIPVAYKRRRNIKSGYKLAKYKDINLNTTLYKDNGDKYQVISRMWSGPKRYITVRTPKGKKQKIYVDDIETKQEFLIKDYVYSSNVGSTTYTSSIKGYHTIKSLSDLNIGDTVLYRNKVYIVKYISGKQNAAADWIRIESDDKTEHAYVYSPQSVLAKDRNNNDDNNNNNNDNYIMVKNANDINVGDEVKIKSDDGSVSTGTVTKKTVNTIQINNNPFNLYILIYYGKVLKKVKPETKKEEPETKNTKPKGTEKVKVTNASEIKPGMTVFHTRYGVSQVVGTSYFNRNNYITIQNSEGKYRLLADIAIDNGHLYKYVKKNENIDNIWYKIKPEDVKYLNVGMSVLLKTDGRTISGKIESISWSDSAPEKNTYVYIKHNYGSYGDNLKRMISSGLWILKKDKSDEVSEKIDDEYNKFATKISDIKVGDKVFLVQFDSLADITDITEKKIRARLYKEYESGNIKLKNVILPTHHALINNMIKIRGDKSKNIIDDFIDILSDKSKDHKVFFSSLMNLIDFKDYVSNNGIGIKQYTKMMELLDYYQKSYGRLKNQRYYRRVNDYLYFLSDDVNIKKNK